MGASAKGTYREVTDANGRVYRLGESDRDILGYPRWLMVLLPWIAMMGISISEYGFGAPAPTLQEVNGWSLSQTFWLVSIWVLFEAGIQFPTGRLREKNIVPAKTAVLTGAVLTMIGFLTLSYCSNIALAFIGFSVLGGTGAGLVYGTCINMVGKWYPEKRGAKTGFVNGGFAYGSLPFIFVFVYLFGASNYSLVLTLIAIYALVVVGTCGMFFKDPPKNWWPEHIDPIEFSRNHKTNRSLAKNPPAVRQYGPMEAIRTGVLPLMWITMVFIGGVSLFGTNYEVEFAKAAGFGPLIAASSMGVIAVVNGVGRAFIGWLSDIMGRKNALIMVLIIESLTQFGVLWSGNNGMEFLFLVFAFLAGFGGGAFFPMFAALTPDYFGENNNATNYGIVYSSKLISGLAGGGLAAYVVAAGGFDAAYITAGCVGLFAVVLSLFLRQPGRGDPPPARERKKTGHQQPAEAF
jgi:MFS family permease